MILIAGATGVLGSEVCRRLRATNHEVRGLIRPGSPKESALREIGVEVSAGDLRSRAAIEVACRGVRAVISTATAMGSKDKSLTLRAIDRDAQLQLVEVARTSGVEHFVYVSLSPNLQQSAPLVRYKREVERAVRASGMRWTILQPSVFMEIWLSSLLGWDFAAGRAMIFGAGAAPINWISVADVAEYAVRSLEDPRLGNRDVALGGPEALSPNEVVRIFEKVSGRRFSAKHIPRPVLALLSPAVGLFNEGAASGMSLGAQTALGDVIESPLQRELALPLTTVHDYATRVVRTEGRSA